MTLLNFGTEVFGAVAIYVVLELLVERRERYEKEEIERKEHLESKKKVLIAQLGSSVKDVAVAAAEELRRNGWLRDGSVQQADLRRADLRVADLHGAYLSGVDLREADLRGADLHDANLRGADLSGAIYSDGTIWPNGFNPEEAGAEKRIPTNDEVV